MSHALLSDLKSHATVKRAHRFTSVQAGKYTGCCLRQLNVIPDRNKANSNNSESSQIEQVSCSSSSSKLVARPQSYSFMLDRDPVYLEFEQVSCTSISSKSVAHYLQNSISVIQVNMSMIDPQAAQHLSLPIASLAHQDISPSSSRTLMLSAGGPTFEASLAYFGGIFAVAIILIILAVICKCIKPETLQKLVKSTKNLPDPNFPNANLRTISYFDYGTLKKATGNFNPENHLGRGGFGPVYKGILDDGRMIAVKQLSLGKSLQGESHFLAEVKMITNIQHKNLVRLVGCCSEGPERLLVYEYMENGSLDSIIYGNSEIFLSWQTRFHIILGIARGLQYLHEESNIRIVHRDIKASNILLDDKFHPKISDFGLARFFPEDQTYLSTAVAGTLGYTAPEYAIRGELSEKADIYSFGVLALEIISCRKNTDLTLPPEMQYLPEYAWKLYDRSSVRDLVDPKLQVDGFSEREFLQVCQVALLCLQPHPSLRPPMSDIVAMLTYKVELTATPMRLAFLDRNRKSVGNMSCESALEIHSAPFQSDSFSSAVSVLRQQHSDVLE